MSHSAPYNRDGEDCFVSSIYNPGTEFVNLCVALCTLSCV